MPKCHKFKKIFKKICTVQKLFVTLQCKNETDGVLAHLARARHWQCRGERFESAILHQKTNSATLSSSFGFAELPGYRPRNPIMLWRMVKKLS